jgi:hypothetical protein
LILELGNPSKILRFMFLNAIILLHQTVLR